MEAIPGLEEGEPDTGIALTLSIGVISQAGPDASDDIVVRADDALYEAKRRGRNQVVCSGDRVETRSVVGARVASSGLRAPDDGLQACPAQAVSNERPAFTAGAALPL